MAMCKKSQATCQDIEAYKILIKRFKCKISFFEFGPYLKDLLKKHILPECNQTAGPSQGLKIRGGARGTVVVIICPLVEIGLTLGSLNSSVKSWREGRLKPPSPLLATARNRDEAIGIFVGTKINIKLFTYLSLQNNKIHTVTSRIWNVKGFLPFQFLFKIQKLKIIIQEQVMIYWVWSVKLMGSWDSLLDCQFFLSLDPAFLFFNS